jgi:hypothetical protein
MAKKTKKYADGGETMSDVLSGNFPAARRFKEGYDQMPDALKDPMLGLSVGKGSSLLQKQIGRLEDTIANNPDRIAGGAEAGKARLQQLKEAADKYSENRQQMGRAEAMKTKSAHLINKSYKKGGTVKSSASKRADGCAIRGKTRGRNI